MTTIQIPQMPAGLSRAEADIVDHLLGLLGDACENSDGELGIQVLHALADAAGQDYADDVRDALIQVGLANMIGEPVEYA